MGWDRETMERLVAEGKACRVTAFLNDWAGMGVFAVRVDVGDGLIVKLFGALTPGEDSWGKPAFVLPERFRPPAPHRFGDFLLINDDGRVIPREAYARYNTFRGYFDLDPYEFTVTPAPRLLDAEHDRAYLARERATESALVGWERTVGWGLFWPEWVGVKVARSVRLAVEYVRALHTLWAQEYRPEGDDDGDE
jgi:hypothetical protein